MEHNNNQDNIRVDLLYSSLKSGTTKSQHMNISEDTKKYLTEHRLIMSREILLHITSTE